MIRILLVSFLFLCLKCGAQTTLVNRYIIISDSLAVHMPGQIGGNNYVWPDSMTDIYGRYVVPSVYGLFFNVFPDSVSVVYEPAGNLHVPAPVETYTAQ